MQREPAPGFGKLLAEDISECKKPHGKYILATKSTVPYMTSSGAVCFFLLGSPLHSRDFFCLLLSSSPPFPNDLCVAVLTCESSAGVSWVESDVHPEGSQVEPRKRERGSLQDRDKNQKE